MLNLLPYLVGAFIGAAVVLSGQGRSEGLAVETSVGQCRLGPSPDGMWWRKDQEHSSRYKENGNVEVGLSYGFTKRFELAASMLSCGAEVNAIVVNCPDDDCTQSNPKNWRRAECAGNAVDCFNRIRGSWTVSGTLLAARYEVARVGPFGIVPELGAFIYQIRGVVRVSNPQCNDGPDCAWQADIVQQTSYYASPEFGLALRHKYFAVGAQYIPRTSQHTDVSPGIGGDMQRIYGRIAIPLDPFFKAAL